MRNNDSFEKDLETEDYETCLDGLLGFLAALPQETMQLLDLPRYSEMLAAAARLKGLLCERDEAGEITIDVDQLFRYGAIRTELDDLTVSDTMAFREIIALADSFEIYPLTSGKLRLSITFQSVLKTIA